MENPVDHYWQIRLQALKESLEKNQFETHVVDDEKVILINQDLGL